MLFIDVIVIIPQYNSGINKSKYLLAPHKRPSVLMALTWPSNSFMSVSSDHGLTSKIILDFATRVGSTTIITFE